MIKSKPRKNSRKPKKYNYGNEEIIRQLMNVFSNVNYELKKKNLELKSCKTIGVDYRITRYLSSGGFGNVSLAIDTRTEKNIIVKEIEIHRSKIDQYLKFVKNELKHLAFFSELIPEYICPLICIDIKVDISPKLIIVMETCGESMYKVITDIISRNIPKPSLDIVLTWFHNIATALHIMHSNNILHLDIKPENILVRDNGNIAIIDFGLSQSIDEYNISRIPVGTPRYVAPEIVSRTFINSGKSDIYSLGVTFNYLTDMYPEIRHLVRDMINPNVLLRPTALEVRQKILELMITREKGNKISEEIKKPTKLVRPTRSPTPVGRKKYY